MSVFWDNRVKSLSEAFLANKKNFLSNENVSKVMQTHNVTAIDNLIEFIDDVKVIEKIKDPKFANPSTHKGVSLQSVRNAAYRKIMNSFFDISEINHVTDFGGGFGNNCRIWYKMGYNGNFAMVDLPEVIEIQKYYLNNVMPNKKIAYISDINNLQINESKSLFFSTYSLGETSLEVRDIVLEQIINHDYIFIAHNRTFPVYDNRQIDNYEYFRDMKKNLSGKFEFFDFNKQLYKSNSRYVIGKKYD